MPSSRKNKWGTRGSVEEETSVAKRSNMANCKVNARNEETEEQAEQEEPRRRSKQNQEPSLQEIKSTLVDIQITVSSIVHENKQSKKELADLKTYIQTKDEEFSELKISVDKTSKSNEALEKELLATATSLEATRRDIDKQSEEIDRFNRKLEVVLKIAAALDVQVAPSDIEISH